MQDRLKILKGYLYLVDELHKADLLLDNNPEDPLLLDKYLDSVDDLYGYKTEHQITNQELMLLQPRQHYSNVADVIDANNHGELL